MTYQLRSLGAICILLAATGSAFGSIILNVSAPINSVCWNFEPSSGISPWINSGGHPWEWSYTAKPDTSDIDTFFALSEYMWFQQNSGTPNTGTIVSGTAPNYELFANDVIGITIYRHLNVFTGVNNPVLNFVTNGGTNKQPILWSYNYDTWDSVTLICGVGDEPCCLTYPCSGYFSVDGEVDAYGDLLAVDNIYLNHDPCTK